MSFGEYIRSRREALKRADAQYSVRKVALRIGVEPAYLSKIERQEVAPPSEEKIRALAEVLGEQPDVLLAMAGRYPPICSRSYASGRSYSGNCSEK